MSNYQNSVIYKIECNDTKIKECYIGSTVDFVMRRNKHKSTYNKGSNLKVYKFIRENGGWENWTMKSIINYPCNSKNELFIKEQEVLKSYNNTLNLRSAYTSIEDKIEYHKQYNKQYYNDNVEKLNKKSRQYHIDNAEKIKEHHKQYYIDNTEKIKKYKSEKIQCECGRLISRAGIARHRKNPTHKSFFSIV